jgi:hypothetical protein
LFPSRDTVIDVISPLKKTPPYWANAMALPTTATWTIADRRSALL